MQSEHVPSFIVVLPKVSDWKVTLSQALAGGVASIIALTIAGWPSNAAEAAWVGLGGFVVGLCVAFAVEYIVKLHREVHRLQGIEQTADVERNQHERHVKLLEYQTALAKRESALSAAHSKVWGDAYTESIKTGQYLPVEALEARLEVTTKALNLDKPLPPPELD